MATEPPDPDAGRAARLRDVLAEATVAFNGDVEKAYRWLQSPVRYLGGETPIKMLETEAETALVRESIGAIAYGGLG